jgi:hypothetical protein
MKKILCFIIFLFKAFDKKLASILSQASFEDAQRIISLMSYIDNSKNIDAEIVKSSLMQHLIIIPKNIDLKKKIVLLKSSAEEAFPRFDFVKTIKNLPPVFCICFTARRRIGKSFSIVDSVLRCYLSDNKTLPGMIWHYVADKRTTLPRDNGGFLWKCLHKLNVPIFVDEFQDDISILRGVKYFVDGLEISTKKEGEKTVHVTKVDGIEVAVKPTFFFFGSNQHLALDSFVCGDAFRVTQIKLHSLPLPNATLLKSIFLSRMKYSQILEKTDSEVEKKKKLCDIFLRFLSSCDRDLSLMGKHDQLEDSENSMLTYITSEKLIFLSAFLEPNSETLLHDIAKSKDDNSKDLYAYNILAMAGFIERCEYTKPLAKYRICDPMIRTFQWGLLNKNHSLSYNLSELKGRTLEWTIQYLFTDQLFDYLEISKDANFEAFHGQLTLYAEIDLLLISKPIIIFCESKYKRSEIKFESQFISILLSKEYGSFFKEAKVYFVGYYFLDNCIQESKIRTVESIKESCNNKLKRYQEIQDGYLTKLNESKNNKKENESKNNKKDNESKNTKKDKYDTNDTHLKAYLEAEQVNVDMAHRIIDKLSESRVFYVSFSELFDLVQTIESLKVVQL